MDEIFAKKKTIADKISILRQAGNLSQAITECKDAIDVYPQENFFHKILGDIYLQSSNIEGACDEYIENLKLITDKPYLFKNFRRFFRTLERVASVQQIDSFKEKIKENIKNKVFSEEIFDALISLFGSDVFEDDELDTVLKMSNNDKNKQKVLETVNTWEKKQRLAYIQALVLHKIKEEDHSQCKRIDAELIVFFEKTGRLDAAIDLIEVSQKPYNFTMQSRILRICRKISNYGKAEALLEINDHFISTSDFNVQYELVYYFQYTNNIVCLEKVLKLMRRGASSSLPIAKTLYNFYLGFNKLDEAKVLYDHIKQLQALNQSTKKSREGVQDESEQFVWERLKNLVSEQEHNRQMVAMRDLLKGFSHELGQPITNIRYGVQLQKIKIQKGIDTPEELETLLNLILTQTSRIGNMLNRFSPIVSSKSEQTIFEVDNCINQVFEDLKSRLATQNISYEINCVDVVKLYGDSTQFSQIFYNLVLNSMQAIVNDGKITVDIVSQNESIKIHFVDNGPGIPVENHQKIFEPFFSTKDPTSGNGGEGLGLFIVWNILKMFNGSIRIDKKYRHGAKFVITLPLLKEEH